MKKKTLYILGATLSFGLLSGCYAIAEPRATVVVPLGSQPHATPIVRPHVLPPRAPTHGYRHRHYDHDLQFDSGFGAYLVIGSPGLYFYGGNYMRLHNNRWQITTRLRDGWRSAGDHDIPLKLRRSRLHQQSIPDRPHRRPEKHRDYDDDDRHDEAPRHGQRRHHQGHDLSYDSRVGAYAIVKRPGIYFYNNRYLRRHNGVWQSSKKLNGGWYAAKERHVPRKLKNAKRMKKEKHLKEKWREREREH